MATPACAFLTMDDMTGFVSYDALVRAPLANRGWRLDEVPWRSDATRWQDYDVVVIRTTWDYQNSPVEFVQTLENIAGVTRLENSLATVRWNFDKRYLRELARNDVAVVPTVWGQYATPEELLTAFDDLEASEIVIKPQIGANADDTLWLRRDGQDLDASIETAATLFAGRRFMLQPFIRNVVEEGEFSLIYFDGVFSHAILKTPKPDDFRVQEEHGGVISAISPESALLRSADRVMATFTDAPLYARVDLVRMEGGDFALMELELIEPSLYLSYDDEAADRFANAIVRRRRRA